MIKSHRTLNLPALPDLRREKSGLHVHVGACLDLHCGKLNLLASLHFHHGKSGLRASLVSCAGVTVNEDLSGKLQSVI